VQVNAVCAHEDPQAGVSISMSGALPSLSTASSALSVPKRNASGAWWCSPLTTIAPIRIRRWRGWRGWYAEARYAADGYALALDGTRLNDRSW